MTAAIILAAGQSRRMGTQKLLLPVAGQPMIARIVDQVLASRVDHTLIVTGQDSRIAAALAGRPVHFATNPDPDGDMLSSIRCGLRALPAECEMILLALGDQPSLQSATIDTLISASQTTARTILVPTFAGKRGHPLLFSTRYRDEVLTQFDSTGLRGLLHAHPDDIIEVPVDHAAILEDVDLPEDYHRLNQ